MTSEAYTTDNSTWVCFIGVKKYFRGKLCHSDDRTSKYYNVEERNAILGYDMYIFFEMLWLTSIAKCWGTGIMSRQICALSSKLKY
mgnify:CR=1 FL=1